jgi:DNA-binding CsgD family transcriptional regulator/tetratricopeptide (TPR) repeat protein
MSDDGPPINGAVALVTGGHRGFGRATVDELLDRGAAKVYATSRTATWLLGRRSERAALDGLVAAVRAGESRALVVLGEPGVGKSALLDYVAGQAAGCRVVRATGVESEMELAFAGLHQLCAPLLGLLGRLPVPQGDALATAFGLRIGEAPDRFLVSLAVLSLFGEAAEERPLVCLVDDAQWLDRASAQVLGFVARRLVAESVGLIFVSRQPSEDSELKDLRELVVEGLPYGDARVLLESVVAGPMDDRVRDRIIAETAGNPLALVELPRGRNPAELAGGFGLPRPGLVSARVEQSFVRRVKRMPAATQRLLLIAAAEPMGDPTLLFQAAERTALDVEEGLRGAEDLLMVNGGVRFRHPLVRSAVYRAASEADRRRVHAALAESIAPGEDEDRRAWHRAQAAAAPDEAVAAELEASAGRAQSRGGLAAAAAFLERAVALTPDPGRRAQRALAAARAAHAAGAADASSTLLMTARRGGLNELEGAQCGLLAAQIAFSSGRGSDAPSLLLAAATRLETLDAGLSRSAYLEATWAAWTAMHLANPIGVIEVSEAVRKAPPATGDPTPEDLMLDGLAARVVDGYPAGAPTLQRALREFSVREMEGHLVELTWVWLAVELMDADAWFELGTRQIQAARAAGALTVLPLALHTIAAWHVLAGDFSLAETQLAEADSIMAATGDAPMVHARLRLAALRGGVAQVLITDSIREATQRGEGVLVRHAEDAAATLYAGLGRYDEALKWAQREVEHNPHAFYMTALPELVEAGVRCDEQDVARRALDALCQKTQASPTAWARGVEARSRALVSAGNAAEGLYKEAIEQLERTRLRAELARAHLLYGEWLRREHRRVDARAQLRVAHGMLSDMGADAFAERARRELLATGETVRKRTVETFDELTPQEVQVARLAAGGQTNPEIGAQLFLSSRTVEWHLRKVFGKLGISSRKELRTALSNTGGAAPSSSV